MLKIFAFRPSFTNNVGYLINFSISCVFLFKSRQKVFDVVDVFVDNLIMVSPDSAILKFMSTSPYIEPPHLVSEIKKTNQKIFSKMDRQCISDMIQLMVHGSWGRVSG